jgi:hypothetical protein
MTRRPFVLTLTTLWIVVAASATLALVTVATDYAAAGQIALVVTALGILIAAVQYVVAVGLWRTRPWARSLGLLALLLSALVLVAVAASVGAWVYATPVLLGNAVAVLVLARTSAPFSDADHAPDEVSAHVGR